MLAALFFPVKARWLYLTTLMIAIVWTVRIVLFRFVSDIFEPTLFAWLNRLAGDLIFLLTLWLNNRKYA